MYYLASQGLVQWVWRSLVKSLIIQSRSNSLKWSCELPRTACRHTSYNRLHRSSSAAVGVERRPKKFSWLSWWILDDIHSCRRFVGCDFRSLRNSQVFHHPKPPKSSLRNIPKNKIQLPSILFCHGEEKKIAFAWNLFLWSWKMIWYK